jgi:hypothetical protein
MSTFKHARKSIRREVRPFVISALTGGIVTGTALVGVGRYASGAIVALVGCVASLLFAVTARLIDSLGL